MTNEIFERIRGKEREIKRLQKKILEAESSLAQTKQELAVAKGAKSAFVEAATLVGLIDDSTSPSLRTYEPSLDRLSEEWVRLMHIIWKQQHQDFGYDDVLAAGAMINKELKKPSARTQVISYVKSGVLVRVRDGRFKFSDKIDEQFTNYTPSGQQTLDIAAAPIRVPNHLGPPPPSHFVPLPPPPQPSKRPPPPLPPAKSPAIDRTTGLPISTEEAATSSNVAPSDAPGWGK